MSTTISGTSGVTFPDSTSMQTGQQACKAWVNFNGTGTVAIRDSYNVSSITDNGTGYYTVNLTTALPDINGAVVITNGDIVPNTARTNVTTGAIVTTTSFYVSVYHSSAVDADFVCAAVFR